MRRHNHNPAQSELFDFARDTGAAVIQTRARSLLIDSRPAPAPTGGAHAPAATLDTLNAQAIGTHTPTAQAGDKGDSNPPTQKAERIQENDRRSVEQRIAALGGVGILLPSDLDAFGKAERALYNFLSDGGRYTQREIRAACGLDSGDKRARNLRKWVARIDGAVRYLHLCKERQPGARVWVYWIEWHPQPQRHNAGQGATHG